MSGLTPIYSLPYADSTDDISAYPTLDQSAKGLIDDALDTIATVAAGKVSKAVVTTKGDLLAATGSGVVDRLPVGANGAILKADSTEATGLKWVSNSGKWEQLAAVSASSGFTLTATGLSGYREYMVRFFVDTTDNSNIDVTFNGDTGANYIYTMGPGAYLHHTTAQTKLAIPAMVPDSRAVGGFRLDAEDPTGLFMFDGWANGGCAFNGHYDPSAALSSITLSMSWPMTSGSLIVYGKR